MRTLIAAALLIASQVPSVATKRILLSSMSTQSLMNLCSKAGSTHVPVDCTGYFLGIFDQMSSSGLICPSESPLLGAEAIVIALKSLQDHPESWQERKRRE
jgi:hypothetical protein